jgi:hypothetical protein
MASSLLGMSLPQRERARKGTNVEDGDRDLLHTGHVEQKNWPSE